MPDHNQTLDVKQMVRNRLPFLEDTPANTTLLSQFTLEAMYELDLCFRIRIDSNGDEVWARVGDEANYNVMQKSIVADLVAIYVLMVAFMETAAGNVSTNTAALQTFLKKAKAGSVEVEYDQFDLKKGTFSIDTKTMLDKIKGDLMRKARGQGCIFDICDDCSLAWQTQNTVIPPFGVFGGDCGCGCS